MTQIETHPAQVLSTEHSWTELGSTLGAALSTIGISRGAIGTALILGTGLLAGCSPSERSYWTGSYTELPPPPPDARMQLGTSVGEHSEAFINYVVWNQEAKEFQRKDIHYSNTMTNYTGFSEAGGYYQKIADGEVLYGGAMVDQANGRIVLADGKYIDGPTGNTYAPNGTLLKAFKPVQAK